jgi:hypothetical protein
MRFVVREITFRRVFDALFRRLGSIPDAYAWRYSSYSKKNLDHLEKYRNAHKGERCFIIANGPSLKRMDLSILRNEHTFSMNRAYLLYTEWGFTPKYYVCINELVLEQFATDIARLQMTKFLNFNRQKSFNGIADSESTMFLRIGLNLADRFTGDVTRTLSSGGTVTYACLELAYFMGFSEVVLVGLDHSFVEKGIPSKTVVRSEKWDESHCHPDYFPKGIKWQLPDLYRSEIAYSLAREAFERDGRRVYDATLGGKCNVFEKVSLGGCI